MTWEVFLERLSVTDDQDLEPRQTDLEFVQGKELVYTEFQAAFARHFQEALATNDVAKFNAMYEVMAGGFHRFRVGCAITRIKETA